MFLFYWLFISGWKQGKSVYQISTTIIFWTEVFPIDCFALWLVILSTITIYRFIKGVVKSLCSQLISFS